MHSVARKVICLDGRDLSETFQGRLSLPEVLRRKVRSAGEHGVTLAPSETKALMTGHRIGTCQIGQAGRRNSAQESEATPGAQNPSARSHAVMVPRKNCKISETRARSA